MRGRCGTRTFLVNTTTFGSRLYPCTQKSVTVSRVVVHSGGHGFAALDPVVRSGRQVKVSSAEAMAQNLTGLLGPLAGRWLGGRSVLFLVGTLLLGFTRWGLFVKFTAFHVQFLLAWRGVGLGC